MNDDILKARINAKKVAVQLYKIRKEKGMTQQDFADAFSVEKSAISNFERGRSVPAYIMLLYASENPALFMKEVEKVYGTDI